MSTLGESDDVSSTDFMQLDHADEAGLSESSSVKSSSHDSNLIKQKWRQIPRNPSDFYEKGSESCTVSESHYEAWLEKYYRELYEEQKEMKRATKSVQAEEEEEEEEEELGEGVETPPEVYTSIFRPAENDFWSYNTKYWGPNVMRRHWSLHVGKNKSVVLPSIHPHLNLRSRYGRFYSLLNSAAALPETSHQKLVGRMFRKNLFGLELISPQMREIMVCDLLCNFKWFDFMSREDTVRLLCKLLRKQGLLEKVYFENMGLDRKEGIVLLCALSRKGGEAVKELHMWRMFGHSECPLLLSDLSRKGDILPTSQTLKFLTEIHYQQVLSKFSNLTHLSINYAYLANRKGDVLVHLKCIRGGSLQQLRIYCTMYERPLLTNPGYGVGGWKIPDGVWRRVVELCPDLKVSFVFLNMAQYENIILFLSKSAPVSYIYISSGMDFKFNVPWDVDSTLLELRNWYAPTLETLCLHLWHHRDLLDIVIKQKILDEFPKLINFEFIGVLECVETLEEFCCKLSKGNYKLKTLMFWVEEEHTNQTKLNLTRKRVDEIRSKFRKKFLVLNIDADLQTYAL